MNYNKTTIQDLVSEKNSMKSGDSIPVEVDAFIRGATLIGGEEHNVYGRGLIGFLRSTDVHFSYIEFICYSGKRNNKGAIEDMKEVHSKSKAAAKITGIYRRQNNNQAPKLEIHTVSIAGKEYSFAVQD
ncbi:MAG: hypothetical protein ACP5N3_04745 [Candidatus Nanoarchaeia archaeon]